MKPNRAQFVLAAACLCLALSGTTNAALIHRYSFSRTDSVLEDTVGGADGALLGAGGSQAGGQLTLPGGSSQTQAYGDLPNGLISGLTDATLEGWYTVHGSQVWQRVFDFGSNTSGELIGPGGSGSGYDVLLYSSNRGTNVNQQRIQVLNNDPVGGSTAGSWYTDPNLPHIFGTEHHFAVVIDDDGGAGGQTRVRFYRDGSLIAGFDTPVDLANLNDVNNWLGRSNWTGDGNFQGSFNEFRIYDEALLGYQIAGNAAQGPDVVGMIPPEASPLPAHRYSFDGTGGDGAVLTDSLGGAHGVLRAADASQLTGTGQMDLGGGPPATAGYGDLPNGIVSGLTEATFEAWATWESNGYWVRIFDFGNTTLGEITGPGDDFTGVSNLFLTTGEGSGGGAMQFTRQNDAGGTDRLLGLQRFPIDGQEHHIAVVYTSDPTPGAGDDGVMELYLDGQFIGSIVTDTTLADLEDVNNWLGRSNWSWDTNFGGRFNEFRIYAGALSEAQIHGNFLAGPDRLNLESVIPEPATLSLLALGGLALFRRRKKH